MGTIKSFRELDIWKKGIELVKEIYKLTTGFPGSELYGLASQMRRCAISIPSNVAEGFRRRHSKEFRQHLNVSLGSLAELETQLVIAKELNYLRGRGVFNIFRPLILRSEATKDLIRSFSPSGFRMSPSSRKTPRGLI